MHISEGVLSPAVLAGGAEQDAIRGPDGKKKKAEYGAVLLVEVTDMQVSK
jgi:hypothetical protein